MSFWNCIIIIMLVQCKSWATGLFRAILIQTITLNALQISLDANHLPWITNLVVKWAWNMLLLISLFMFQKAIQIFASSTGSRNLNRRKVTKSNQRKRKNGIQVKMMYVLSSHQMIVVCVRLPWGTTHL